MVLLSRLDIRNPIMLPSTRRNRTRTGATRSSGRRRIDSVEDNLDGVPVRRPDSGLQHVLRTTLATGRRHYPVFARIRFLCLPDNSLDYGRLCTSLESLYTVPVRRCYGV